MEDPTKEQVIHRAYQLWEQAGKPEGRDQEFYHEAERQLAKGEKMPEENTRLEGVRRGEGTSLPQSRQQVNSFVRRNRFRLALGDDDNKNRIGDSVRIH